ncbi:MAG: neutral/alkaline non-lysosomal ceramidase N-terminal domain-containing protein [Acidimicrobiales bacterium]
MSGRPGPLRPFVDRDRGRAAFSVSIAEPDPLPQVDRLLAGAAEVDLTPPPGMPKAGYSSNAHDGVGFRTRLRARILHLRCGRSSIAIVQCDLLGGSSVLQFLVADAIADRTDIPLAGLMIGATHTHAGPGQFSGTDFYNRFASNRSGFDPAWAQFLVDRIAAGVVEAYESRVPAFVAVGSTEVWGSTRNRSLDPHVQNETVVDKRQEPQRKFASINPELHLVRVDRAADDGSAAGPLGAAVIFSVHGTGVSQHAREYNADLWAYLVDELGHRIETARGERGVVGAMEGTHADMAPALHPGRAGHIESRRIGRQIGAEAADLYERLGAELADTVELACGLREIDMTGGASIDGVSLPDRPAVGAALVAGAKENLTPVVQYLPPFRAGFPKPFDVDGEQGRKWVIGSKWLQPLVLPLRSFPRRIPVQMLRVGRVAVVGLPFEVTVESGRRIVAAGQAALDEAATARGDSGIERVIVSSVANEYCGYVATAEEYSRQYYEGGHTLYGPNTQRFLAAHVRRLVGEVAAADPARPVVTDVGTKRSWDLRIHRYLARRDAARVGRSALGTPRYVDATGDEDGYWEFRWRDEAPGNLLWHEAMVRVEQRDATGEHAGEWLPAVHDGRRVDDQGTSMEVRSEGTDSIGHVYAARWHDPAFRVGRMHRFVVLANGTQAELASVPFD